MNVSGRRRLPLDTANIRFINGFADDSDLRHDHESGNLQYKFQVGNPNPSPPFIKTLQIIGTSWPGRNGQFGETGYRNRRSEQTEHLHDDDALDALRHPARPAGRRQFVVY
jgi:hypothetical protein